ncbi:MAG: hypothetical protein AAGA85_07705 [Bacteroidota bacterium]
MKSRRRAFLLLWFAVTSWWAMGQVVLREPLLMAGDTLEGVAFMRDEGLSGYAYFMTLFDEQGARVDSKLVWVEKQQFHFRYPLSVEMQTGVYQLQLTNYQNLAVTHAVSVLIIAADGTINGLPEFNELPLQPPSRSYLGIDIADDQSSQMAVTIEPLLDSDDIQSLTIVVRDLGQNPLMSESIAGLECEGVAEHQLATRGLNQWMTSFHVEGWLMRGEEAVIDETITFADPTDVEELRYTTTNETGKFGFYNVDFDGAKEVFIAPLNGEIDDYKLLLGDSRTSALAPAASCPAPFAWKSGDLKTWINKRLLNRKVEQYYYPTELPRRQLSLPNPQPLFEDADHTILMDDYVAFEDVREVIKEVVPYVHLNKKRLQVFSPERRRSFEGVPLLLLNGVPVANDTALLRMEADLVHSVQVLNKSSSIAPLGRIGSAGVVSFVTRDVAYRLEGAEPNVVKGFLRVPASVERPKRDDVPYFPAVLAWQPTASLVDGIHGFTFERPDYATRISIEAVAHLNNGEVIMSTKVLDVNRRAR